MNHEDTPHAIAGRKPDRFARDNRVFSAQCLQGPEQAARADAKHGVDRHEAQHFRGLHPGAADLKPAQDSRLCVDFQNGFLHKPAMGWQAPAWAPFAFLTTDI